MSLTKRQSPIALWKITVAALLMSVFLTVQQYIRHYLSGYDFAFSWQIIFITELTNYVAWIALWPLLVLVSNAFTPRTTARMLRGVCMLAAVALLHRVATHSLHDLVYYLQSGHWRDFFGTNSLTVFTAGLFKSLIEAAVITGIIAFVNYQKKYLEQQRQLARAQLDALRMQVNPHFLFNALHSVATLVDLDPKAAQKMIAQLGSLFRKVLKSEHVDMVTIEDELSFVREYLAIEKVRFRESLLVNWEIDEEVKHTLVPNMVLQPLLENAIKHGGPTHEGVQHIHLKVRKVDGGVELAVTNDIGKASKLHDSEGVGLRNVKARLERTFEQFEFLTGPQPDNTYETSITIPA